MPTRLTEILRPLLMVSITGSNPVLATDNNNSGVRVLLALKGVCFQRFESESGGGWVDAEVRGYSNTLKVAFSLRPTVKSNRFESCPDCKTNRGAK